MKERLHLFLEGTTRLLGSEVPRLPQPLRTPISQPLSSTRLQQCRVSSTPV